MHPADLAGQVAIVTRGASGIGLGIARRLAQAGATAILADLSLSAAEQAAAGVTGALVPVPGQH